MADKAANLTQTNHPFAASNSKKIKKSIIYILLLCIVLSGCVTLQPTTITRSDNDNFSKYKYFYVNPTGSKTGSSGAVFGNQYGVFGGSSTKSTAPCDVITGFLIRKGYVRVAEINDDNRGETFVINYGEVGRRMGFFCDNIEIVLQFISASTSDVFCTVSGEGSGETEADVIRVAIERCLNTAFSPN